MPTELDLFQASPFAEDYPLSKEQVVGQQDGSAAWSSDIDHQLSLFVRKYCFDFAKASKALRSYVQHVLVEMDEVDADSQTFTEEACRKRWALLDREEFERRQVIARELMTMREVVDSRIGSPATPQTSTPAAVRHLGEEASLPTSSGAASRRAGSSSGSTPSLAPDPPRVGASPAPAAQRIPAPTQPSSSYDTEVYSGVKSAVHACLNGTHAEVSAQHSCAVERTSVLAAEVPLAGSASGLMQAWSEVPAASEAPAPARVSVPRARSPAHDDANGDSESSEDIGVVDPAALREGAKAAYADRSEALPLSMSELERRVQEEKLERSDFTIFTHDLKKTCDGFYKSVMANLPRIQVEEMTDDDDEDDDIVPVFSNLRTNEHGEYVGRLRVGPLFPDAASAPADALHAATDVPGRPSLQEEALCLHAAGEGKLKHAWGVSTVAAPAPASVSLPRAVASPAVEATDDSSEEDDEAVQVIDTALYRGAIAQANKDLRQGAAATPAHSPPAAPASVLASAAVGSGVGGREQASQLATQHDKTHALLRAEADMRGEDTSKDKEDQHGERALLPAASRLSAEESAKLESKLAAAVKECPAVQAELEGAKGLGMVAKGNLAGAIEPLSAAIRGAGIVLPAEGERASSQGLCVSREDAVAWLLARGKCYLHVSECYNAVPDLDKAVALDGASVEARLQYAIALRFSCRYVEAQEQIKYLLKLDPSHAHGKLEERRLQQRIAHVQGRDLDTWRRKDSVIAKAKEIQECAERSIEKSRSRVESLQHQSNERELDKAFFAQVAAAEKRQAEEREKEAQQSCEDAILDVDLGGVDVDQLLQDLHNMQPDPNVFPAAAVQREVEEDSPAFSSLPPLLQALVGSFDDPILPKPAPAPDGTSAAEVEPPPPPVPHPHPADVVAPTAREVGANARALKSNTAGMFEASYAAPVSDPTVTYARAAAPTAVAAVAGNRPPVSAASPPLAQEEQGAGSRVSKGAIGAKLRALREGQATIPAAPAVAAARPAKPSAGGVSNGKGAGEGSMVVVASAQEADARKAERKTAPQLVAHVPSGKIASDKENTFVTPDVGKRTEAGAVRREEPSAAEQKLIAQQQRARGRIQMAASDDDKSEEEEEEDLLALRSKLKAQSKKLSPEEQAEEERKREARRFLDERAQQDREEHQRRRQEEAARRKAEEERQQHLAALAEESARKRRDKERELQEREEAERQRRLAQEQEAARALEEEEDALLRDKQQAFSAKLAAARAQLAAGAAAEAHGQGSQGGRAGMAPGAADLEIEEAEEEEAVMLQARLKDAQRQRDARVEAAKDRHKKMMERSKGPIAALPPHLCMQVNGCEALKHAPGAVRDLCVVLLPDMDSKVLAGLLHWIVTPSSLAAALESVPPAEREGYGCGVNAGAADEGSASARGQRPVFPFHVVGLMRGVLSAALCMPALLPPMTQKRTQESGTQQPVLMIALAPPRAFGVARDFAEEVKALLASVSLQDLYFGDRESAPVLDPALHVPLTSSLATVASVVSGKSAVSPAVPSPIFWFTCAPAIVDRGDLADASGAVCVPADDTLVSVLRPEAVGRGALGPVFARLAEENLDLTALRMLYPSREHYERVRSFTSPAAPGGCPILVMGMRGYKAVDRWQEVLGPEDPLLAKRTDPGSLRALFGVSRQQNLMTCSRSSERNRRESQWYFSMAHDMELDDASAAAALPAIPLLVPYAEASTVMVLRAGVSGTFVAKVVSLCLRSGFRLSGFRRSSLERAACQHVGLPPWISHSGSAQPPVCLLWTAENAVMRLLRLGPALGQLSAESFGVSAQFGDENDFQLSPAPVSRAAPSPKAVRESAAAAAVFESHAHVLTLARTSAAAERCSIHLDLLEGPECVDKVRFMSRLADLPSRFSANKGVPQPVCILLTPDAVTDAAALEVILDALLASNADAELLGAKMLRWMPEHAAAECCPFAKDHYLRDDFLEHVENGPVLALALRMPDGPERVARLIGPLPGSGALTAMQSLRDKGGGQTLRARFAVDAVRCALVAATDATHSLRMLSCLFEDDELSWPLSRRTAGALVPPPSCDNVIEGLKAEAEGPPSLRTVALVKPEARHNLAKILKYVRRGGFKMICAKMVKPSQEEKRVLMGSPDMSSPSPSSSTSTSSPCSLPSSPNNDSEGGARGGPCIALVLQRQNAVAAWLDICGDADPAKAKRDNEFSLRATFGRSPALNALHASSSFASAVAELQLLFPEVRGGRDSVGCSAKEGEEDGREVRAALQQGDAVCGTVLRQVVSAIEGKSLREPVVVVLCEEVLAEEEHFTVIETLMREDFRVINLRLTWLSTKQATQLSAALGHRALEEEGRKGPCLILAMERDSGISRLQMAMNARGSGGLGTLAGNAKMKNQIFYSANAARAKAALAYCFDTLWDSVVRIEPAA